MRRHLKDWQIPPIAEKKLEIEKIKAEQRQKEHGNTAPGKPRNTGGKFSTSVIGVSSDSDRFNQGEELEPIEKIKAKQRQESTYHLHLVSFRVSRLQTETCKH